MAKTGLRIELRNIRKRINRFEGLQANAFMSPLLNYTQKVLNSCVTMTPERDAGLIRRNQRKQYRHRVDYIPSYHTLENPSLIVNSEGEHWLFYGGKWYKASEWNLPGHIYSAYSELIEERNRRLQTTEGEFVTNRLQARSLYKKTWMQCGESIGLSIRSPGRVPISHSRRQPQKEPKRGYAQIRGGSNVLSIVIFNPFLDEETAYWSGNGKLILDAASTMHKAGFDNAVKKEFNRILRDVARS